MARRRKNATEEMRELAQKIAGMKTIDANYDAGNGVTLRAAEELLARGETSMGNCNQAVAAADDADNTFKAVNKEIRAFNKKVLPATGLKYGTDSSQYELVGGVRESERKRPARKKTGETT